MFALLIPVAAFFFGGPLIGAVALFGVLILGAIGQHQLDGQAAQQRAFENMSRELRDAIDELESRGE